MIWLGVILLGGGVTVPTYAYIVYPALLACFARKKPNHPTLEVDSGDSEHEWPAITIAVAAYNEEATIADSIENLLALDYPTDRLEIVVISDGSSDNTDQIVRGFEDRDVRLFATGERCGKTEAENRAAPTLRGEIIVNTDATIRFPPESLKPLIRPFRDPSVGLASGRDVSVSPGEDHNRGESGYVGYEMAVRAIETGAGGIVGASGCFYAIRTPIHALPVPGGLSRDFAAALKTHEAGAVSVSVDDALCFVPRQHSLHQEYRRKVRTMARGMGTLWHWRRLMNPRKHPLFAFKLVSHKVFRWLTPWTSLLALGGLALLTPLHPLFFWGLGAGATGLLVGGSAWAIADAVRLPSVLSLLAFALMGNAAAFHAALRLFRGSDTAIWEPTRRR